MLEYLLQNKRPAALQAIRHLHYILDEEHKSFILFLILMFSARQYCLKIAVSYNLF